MQNLKRKIDKIKAKLLTNQQFLNNFSKNNRLEPKNRPFPKYNKRHLRADVLSLLSSALRPRLLVRDSRKSINFANFAHCSNIPNCIKSVFRNANRGRKIPNVAKIVVMTTILSIFGLFSLNSATSVYADSLTLTIPSSPLSLDLNPSVNSGFATTSGSFNVKTDNVTGYTTSIRSKNGSSDNSLINGNHKLTSITEATTEDSFKTNPKFLNMWGWMPSKLNSESNTNYQISPGAEEVVLDKTEEPSSDTGTDYNISLAAKIASDTPTGTYTNIFTISAVSNELPPDGIIQNWDGCNDLDEGQSLRLMDIRDNNIYAVAKLKDGKCWMTQNLRLVNKTLTPEDSNVTSTYVLPDTSDSYSFNSYNQSYVQYVNQTYGTYYSWYAATAGQGTGADNRNTDTRITDTSICPSGWHLPTKSETTELVSHYDYKSIQAPPANFSLSGANRVNEVSDQGIKGMYWAANAYDNKYGYMIVLNNSTRALGAENSFGDKAYGFSVRCITKPEKSYSITYELNGGENGPESPQTGKTKEDTVKLSDKTPNKNDYEFLGWCTAYTSDNSCSDKIYQPNTDFPISKNNDDVTLWAIWKSTIPTTMQEFGDYCDKMSEHQVLTLRDSRDGNMYEISKLKDGMCWMTQNLRFGDEKLSRRTIGPSGSDMSISLSLPNNDASKFKTSSFTAWALYVDSTWGGYYSWSVLTARSGNDGYGNDFSPTPAGQDAPSSICPEGWRLPSRSNFQDLISAYDNDSSKLLANPGPNFTLSGWYYGSNSPSSQNQTGYYWASTSAGYDGAGLGIFSAYYFSISTERTGNGTVISRIGNAARCVAR